MKRRTAKAMFREQHRDLPASEVEALWRLQRQQNEAWQDFCYGFQQFVAFSRAQYEARSNPAIT